MEPVGRSSRRCCNRAQRAELVRVDSGGGSVVRSALHRRTAFAYAPVTELEQRKLRLVERGEAAGEVCVAPACSARAVDAVAADRLGVAEAA